MMSTVSGGKRRRLSAAAQIRQQKQTQKEGRALASQLFEPYQRRKLRRDVIACVMALCLLIPTLLLFLALLGDPEARGSRFAVLLFVAVPGMFSWMITSLLVTHLTDLLSETVVVQTVRLNEQLRSHKGNTVCIFEGLGKLTHSYDSDMRLPGLPQTEEGGWYRIVYSPNSRILWTMTE